MREEKKNGGEENRGIEGKKKDEERERKRNKRKIQFRDIFSSVRHLLPVFLALSFFFCVCLHSTETETRSETDQ